MQRFAFLFAALAGLAACADDSMMGDDDDAVDPMPDPEPTPRDFTVRIENVAPWTVLKAGLASTKVVPAPGPLGPGEAFDVTLTAGRNQRFNFAAMFGESNDWFFGPGPEGIPLYDDAGNPVTGDVTAQVALWNAGTEIDQEPFVGDSTGPKQTAPDFGAPDPDPTVRDIPSTVTLTDGSTFTRPAIADMIRVTVTPGANRQFTIRIANVSTDATLQTSAGARSVHISPAVWALHQRPAPLFETGTADRGQGLELVAESGRGANLSTVLGILSGSATPVSPGVFAIHQGESPLYSLGRADAGLGLERISENGDPTLLGAAMASVEDAVTGIFNTPVGADAPGAARPGSAYEIPITAIPGDRVSFVQMFGWSNDWFFATDPDGIALFDGELPIEGDVSHMIAIYDVGTELDQELAIGADTGPQQMMPDQGALDPIAQVRSVAPRYSVPASAHLRVTITLAP
jgi:hypothetical protein